MENGFINTLRRAKQPFGLIPMLLIIITVVLSACGKENEVVSPVVQVKAGEISGSGILYEKREECFLIITAAHVLQAAVDSVEVVFEDGYITESNVYTLSQTSDIAFIEVPLEEFSEKQLQSYIPVTTDKERFDKLTEGEEMTLSGIPANGNIQDLDATLIYPWIYTEDFNQYMMLIRGEILPGMSGGGAFDSAGNFVGILCGVSEDREIAAVPLSIILSEYSLIYE